MPRDNIKRKRIILELLHKPDGSLTKYKIAKETDSNISWVLETLYWLEKKKIIKNTKVRDVDKLIDAYIILDKQRHFDFHIPQPIDYLKSVKMDYALTTYASENLVSHILFTSRVDVYIKAEDFGKWKTSLLKKGLIGGGNLRIILSNDNHFFKFAYEIDSLKTVSLPMLLIDLKREGGVGMEAYSYLVKKYVQG